VAGCFDFDSATVGHFGYLILFNGAQRSTVQPAQWGTFHEPLYLHWRRVILAVVECLTCQLSDIAITRGASVQARDERAVRQLADFGP